MNITPINASVVIKTDQPNQHVIQLLEELLTEAKSGSIEGIAMAWQNHKFNTVHRATAGIHSFAGLGNLHALLRRYEDLLLQP